MNFFARKIKIASILAAMLLSALGGAFVALKISTGTDFADALVRREIEERVSEKISRIRATQGDVLELAVLESVLTFEHADAWRNVPDGLGKSVSQVSVPAVFRFFVKISEPISVRAEEQDGGILLCTVVAPKLRPVLPVAFDTSKTVWKRDVGIFRFNGEEMTDALREKISMRLVLSAKNHAKTAAVRDAAREAFADFVRQWLQEIRGLRERFGENVSVKIVFADEVPPPEIPPEGRPSAVPVTL